MFSVAPMMDWTDRHCRAFHRALTTHALLYTEMVTCGAVRFGDRTRLLSYDPLEHPVALQLGGSDPVALADAAKIGADLGYDEINLNVGCPSDRVQSGRFGACLMREPQLVADCVAAMAAAVAVPVTVKCRLGVDDQDPEESLFALVEACASAGIDRYIVHARKAWLSGLSPKENRDIPPLDYGLVYRLKQARPDLTIILNGGLTDLEAAAGHLAHLDGIMFGRAAYHDPGLLGRVDPLIYETGTAPVSALEAVDRHRPYLARQLAAGVPLSPLVRPMLGLFAGEPGARTWRRILTVESIKSGAGLEVVDQALTWVIEAAAAKEARIRVAG